MIRICCVFKTLICTGQEIKIITVKSMFSNNRMKSLWNHYYIVMLSPNNFINGPVFCINLLNCVSFGFLKFIKISFFLNRLQNFPIAIYYSFIMFVSCLLYTSPSPRDKRQSRMPSSA